MRKRILSPLVAVAALTAGLNATPTWAATIVCESNNGRTQRCPADTRGGVRLVTQYSKQGCYQGDNWGYDRAGIWVSNGCRAQFQTGGYSERQDRDKDNGNATAAAAVALGIIGAVALANRHHDHNHNHDDDYHDRRRPYDDYDDYRDRPRPNDYGYRPDEVVRCDRDDYCPVRIGRGRVEIQRQLSNAACRFNSSWGYDRGGIWVDRGCRADFAVFR